MWLDETLASGMALYYHFIGSEAGFGEDRRWQKLGSDYFQWAKKHDAHLKPRRSLANIGVIIGQSTQLLYPTPDGAHAHDYMRETTHGIYAALLCGRFAFDFVHEDRLDLERISKYRALLLPNIAILSDRQCQQIRDYVSSGGSIMASFETGLYDENLQRREEFALADLVYGVVYRWVADSADSGPYCVLRSLLLVDTRFSGSRRALEYNRETDDPAKVQGFLLVTYAPQ